jgi:quercetin dioxygenase-like cupin family protein
MNQPIVLSAEKSQKIDQDWGQLTWFANAEIGNSQDITVGRCILKPGQGNPKHSHPNCGEVLVVVKGRIRHTGPGGKDVEMGPGDTISIPPKFLHRAENIGADEAVLIITFTSAHRQVEGE